MASCQLFNPQWICLMNWRFRGGPVGNTRCNSSGSQTSASKTSTLPSRQSKPPNSNPSHQQRPIMNILKYILNNPIPFTNLNQPIYISPNHKPSICSTISHILRLRPCRYNRRGLGRDRFILARPQPSNKSGAPWHRTQIMLIRVIPVH